MRMKREKGVSVSGNRGKESIEGIRCITRIQRQGMFIDIRGYSY